jgi:hypothetical protein
VTQHNLGAVLATLGEREGGTARLQEAVEAFRAALAEFEAAGAGRSAAAARRNLARAAAVLAERRGRAAAGG